MTWLQFITWLAGLYSCYYLINILLDSRRIDYRNGKDTEAITLSFNEKAVPVKVAQEPVTETITPPAVKGLGGVNIHALFELSKLESIQYTQGVSF